MSHYASARLLSRTDLLSAYLDPKAKRTGLTRAYKETLETIGHRYSPVRHPTRLCVLYWLDTYGPMSAGDLVELLHNTCTRSQVARMLHSLARAYWVALDTSGDTARWVYMARIAKP